jgi:hypothetical protein
MHMEHQRAGVIGNERLTALAGALLLALIAAELVTAAYLHALLSLHVFVGVLLAGPLAVKLASTGYRFVGYYARSLVPPSCAKARPTRRCGCWRRSSSPRPSRWSAAGSDSW